MAANLNRRQKLLNDNDKHKLNLLNSLKLCNPDSVRKTIFEELANMEAERSEPVTQIAIEKARLLDISIPQIKFFLSQLKKGNVNYIKDRRTLLDVLINRVYLYDGRIVIIFNTGKRPVELNA